MNKKFFWLCVIIILIVVIIGFLGKSHQDEKIRIGAIFPLTGQIALSGGEQCAAGARMAVEDINNSGGINNKTLDLAIEDSRSNNKDGATAYNYLVSTYDPIAILSMGSALSKTLSPMADQNKITLLTTITTDPNLTQNNDFIFRYYPTAEQEIPIIIKMAKERGIKKFAVLNLNDDFGKAMLTILKDSFGGDVISESFNISNNDFRTELIKIKSKKPDGLLIVGFADHVTTAIRQAKELEVNSTVFSSSLVTIPSVRKSLNDIGIDVFAPASAVYKKDLNSYTLTLKNKFANINSQIEFDHYVVSCYDTIRILEKVLKNGQSTKEGVKNGLINLGDFNGLLGNVTIKKKEFSFPLYPAKITKGEVMFMKEKNDR